MSAEVCDPEPEEPEFLDDRVHQAAYNDYLEGLVLGDTSMLITASHIIEDAHFPLARTIRRNIHFWEDMHQTGDDEQRKVADGSLLSDVIRSYVYSGIEIDAGMVLFANEILGFDRKWLRGVVVPGQNTTLAWLRRDGMTAAQQSDAVYYGKRALLTLGLSSFSLRLSARLGFLH